MKLANTLAEIFSASVLLLFLYTGISKLFDFEKFNDVLKTSPLLKHYAIVIAWALPVIEIIIAILLFIPATRLAGLYASLLLLVGMTLYLGWMIVYAPKLPCNCGGVISQLSWRQHLFFNSFFIILIIAAMIIFQRTKGKPKRAPPSFTTKQ